jgi:short-subunit dehydrogenase
MPSVAFVTGATSGLGKAVAERFAEEGVSVALFARRENELERVADAARTIGVTAETFVVDLRKPAALHAAANAALARFGRVDVLVNNAGWSPKLHRVLDTSLKTWDDAMNLNARAGYLMTRACLPSMLGQGSGYIVDVCTAAVAVSAATVSAYRASKAAQRAFAQSLRAELRETGVRVLTVFPEPMDTPMRWAATPDFPRNRALNPQDVAALIVDLATRSGIAYLDEVFVRAP